LALVGVTTQLLLGNASVENFLGDLTNEPRTEPKVKDKKSSAKDGKPERLRRKTMENKEMRKTLQRVSAGAARSIRLPLYPNTTVVAKA